MCGMIHSSAHKAIYFRLKHLQQNLNNLSGMCQIECFMISFWFSLVEHSYSKSFVIIDFSTNSLPVTANKMYGLNREMVPRI